MRCEIVRVCGPIFQNVVDRISKTLGRSNKQVVRSTLIWKVRLGQRFFSLTHWRRELLSESRLQEFQPCLATLATCQTANSRYVALRAEHALLYTVKRLIVRWHAALFMLQHSCGQGSRRGHCEAGDFHANLAFSFLDNTQRSITIYTRARVSLLSPCSLEHWPSIIAEKPAVETQFLRRL